MATNGILLGQGSGSDSDAEIGYVFTPSKIYGYNATTIKNLFKKHDEILAITLENNGYTTVAMGISPDALKTVELMCEPTTSSSYFNALLRYQEIDANDNITWEWIEITSGTIYRDNISILDMDNDGCIFYYYLGSSIGHYIMYFDFTTKTCTTLYSGNIYGYPISQGSSLGITSAPTENNITHFQYSGDYLYFYVSASLNSMSGIHAYNKELKTVSRILSFSPSTLTLSTYNGAQAFKTPTGFGIVNTKSTTSSSERHHQANIELYNSTGTLIQSFIFCDYIGTASDKAYIQPSWLGCYGNSSVFYIAVSTSTTSYANTKVIDAPGVYQITADIYINHVSNSIPPLTNTSSSVRVIYNPDGIGYPINYLYHSDLYDKLLSQNGLSTSNIYKDKISEYKAVPYYDAILTDAGVTSNGSPIARTELPATMTLGKVRSMGVDGWYMGNCFSSDWFLFKFDESKLIPITI